MRYRTGRDRKIRGLIADAALLDKPTRLCIICPTRAEVAELADAHV